MTTRDTDRLARRFEDQRPRLTAVAYRMLGSATEAEDAVQETWIRLSRSDADAIEDLGSWLTTVLARACLNVLQARRSRPEVPLGPEVLEPVAGPAAGPGPEDEALLQESVGLALLTLLDALSPGERVALVLHDMFGVPFEAIAPILGRNAAAARQLASRARRRVRRTDPRDEPSGLRQARLVDAFLAAARHGEFDRLLALLDPEVVLTADRAAAALGVAPEVRGAAEVAEFLRYARGATPAFLDGAAAVAWIPGGRTRVVYRFTIRGDRIAAVELIADPERLSGLDLEVVPG